MSRGTKNMLSIILIEPHTPGNIGAVARLMQNFILSSLILVNPKCDHLSREALDRASHAKDILKKARIVSRLPKTFDYLIGTTARLGTDYNIPRCPLSPRQLGEKLAELNLNRTRIGILFGREDHGLSNAEIRKCDFIVTIESSRKHPTLNLSHAVAIVLYDIFKVSAVEHVSSHIIPATLREKEQIMKMVEDRLSRMHFPTEGKRETQRKLWKRMVSKAFLTKREAYALMGFLKRVK